MHYKINVSLNGLHLFATSDHSLTDKNSFIRCVNIIKKKFPKSEGYKVDSTLWKSYGEYVDDLGNIE
jgi:hypothetical protein